MTQEAETPQKKNKTQKANKTEEKKRKLNQNYTKAELWLYPLFYCMDISYNKVIKTIC